MDPKAVALVTEAELQEIAKLDAAWKHPPVGRKDEARAGIPERLAFLGSKLVLEVQRLKTALGESEDRNAALGLALADARRERDQARDLAERRLREKEAAEERAEMAEVDNGDAERSRVIRCRNACFAGVKLTPEARAAIEKFDGMILRGKDPGAADGN